MNLRAAANSMITGINPNQKGINWIQSNGYTTNAAGQQIPTTITTQVDIQIQANTGEMLRHIDSLGLQGLTHSVYMYFDAQGVVRADAKGGDILQFAARPENPVHDWLIVSVVETWSNWAHVIVQLQVT
jgi:hypothetical protein